jgi:sigma-54 dependent transcriptional regulator of gfr operon
LRTCVLNKIIEATQTLDWSNMEPFTANCLCRVLPVNRNTVSQYLNEYVQQNILIKVKSRPVYFLHRETLEHNSGVSLQKNHYETLTELREELSGLSEQKDFSTLFGHNGSLAYCVEQCQSSASYPPNGLPTLLYGEAGVGKSQMARLMYEYSVNTGYLAKGAPFVTLNCAEYANNPELMATNLFGHVKGAYTGAVSEGAGLLSAANGGVLFLDEVHCLAPACQEKLFLFMDQGIYHKIGNNTSWHSAAVRFIFATTERPEEVLLKTLLRRIPVVVQIPPLAERPENERHDLILNILKGEMRETGRQFLVSKNVIQLLMRHRFHGNIGEMKNIIRATCANAFLTSEDSGQAISVQLSNLPDYFLARDTEEWENPFGREQLMTLEALETEFYKQASQNDIYLFMIQAYEEGIHARRSFEDFWETVQSRLRQYQDQLSYELAVHSPRLELLESLMDSMGAAAAQRFSLILHNSDLQFMARHFYRYAPLWAAWPSAAKHLDSMTAKALPREYAIAAELNEFLHSNVRIARTPLDRVFFTAVIAGQVREIVSKTICFILCHGHSAASSIAGSANAILDCCLFDAVDMPLGVPLNTVTGNLLKRVAKLKNCEQIVFLVDLGSLEEIPAQLSSITANIGVVNNVSLELALCLGQQLLDGVPLEQALEYSTEQSRSKWSITRNRKRKDAILCVCATGIETARKIADLVRKCLPEGSGLEVLSDDFERLAQQKQDAPLFRDYHVKLMIGTLDPRIKNIPFVSLDQLLMEQNVDLLHRQLSLMCSNTSASELEENLVREFTIQNVMRQLTILNGEKLMGVVVPAVQALMEKMRCVFSHHIVTGLCLHLCCMVEKLVMHRAVSDGHELDRFAEEHASFIKQVRESFSGVEREYSVEIPLSEIQYLYLYVSDEKKDSQKSS